MRLVAKMIAAVGRAEVERVVAVVAVVVGVVVVAAAGALIAVVVAASVAAAGVVTVEAVGTGGSLEAAEAGRLAAEMPRRRPLS